MAASRALVDTNPPVSTQIKGISARRDGPLPCPYPVKCGSLLCPQHPTAPASAYVPVATQTERTGLHAGRTTCPVLSAYLLRVRMPLASQPPVSAPACCPRGPVRASRH